MPDHKRSRMGGLIRDKVSFGLRPWSPLPRWIESVRIGLVMVRSRTRFFPIRSGLPGAHNRSASTPLCFEACSGYHSRYGLQFCSPTSCGLCHEAPARTVPHPDRSSATQAYRFLLAWDFHPLVICAIGAHVRDMKVEVASNHGLDSSRGHAAAAAFCGGQANNAAAAACPRV
jgi:hypothetical protein